MSQKINTIVFSRERASQLKLFLDSVNKYASGVFDLNVLYTCIGEKHQEAYKKIINNSLYEGVNFINADEFKEQTISLLKTKSKYSCFFLDDDILYKEVKFSDIDEQISSDDDIVCFSLRLGENTTKCYTLGADNVLHDIESDGKFMKWDWSLHYLDFGYPFAMDGHVFRSKDIYKLVKKSKFTNVDELEMALFDYTEMFPRNIMTSYVDSHLVNVPCGRVQVSLDDEMTMALKESESRVRRERMNNTFLSGKFIDLEKIDFSNIEGCHQVMNFGEFDIELKSSSMDMVALRNHGKRWDELTKEEQKEINDSIDKIEEMVKSKSDG